MKTVGTVSVLFKDTFKPCLKVLDSLRISYGFSEQMPNIHFAPIQSRMLEISYKSTMEAVIVFEVANKLSSLYGFEPPAWIHFTHEGYDRAFESSAAPWWEGRHKYYLCDNLDIGGVTTEEVILATKVGRRIVAAISPSVEDLCECFEGLTT